MLERDPLKLPRTPHSDASTAETISDSVVAAESKGEDATVTGLGADSTQDPTPLVIQIPMVNIDESNIMRLEQIWMVLVRNPNPDPLPNTILSTLISFKKNHSILTRCLHFFQIPTPGTGPLDSTQDLTPYAFEDPRVTYLTPPYLEGFGVHHSIAPKPIKFNVS